MDIEDTHSDQCITDVALLSRKEIDRLIYMYFSNYSVHTTTEYRTEGRGLGGPFFLFSLRQKISTTAMTRRMTNTPPMTPPTIAPIDGSSSARFCGTTLSPDKRSQQIITLLLLKVLKK